MEKMSDILKKMEMVREPGLHNPNALNENGSPIKDDKMSLYMKQMTEVKEPGLYNPGSPLNESAPKVVNNGNSMINNTLAYDRVKEDVNNDSIGLKEEARVRMLGAIQVIKELVVNEEKSLEDPLKTLRGVKKIIDSFE